jgi:uncharacterized protein involved in outer membrane biogenesis
MESIRPMPPITSDSESSSEVPAVAPETEPELPLFRWKRKVTLIAGVIALIAAAVVLPPLINMGRYQRQVTALVSRSMGRPVRLRSVELHLLPRPGFVLNDLQVSEDPNFGAEPVLSANRVVASIGIFSLWRGRLAINRISVDEASLNLVRSPDGRWNLETLMMGGNTGQVSATAGKAGGARATFPYLEATNSRVNFKNGVEKSPYSLTDTDLSLWQDEPGKWRVRLRGQPVRTDIEMSPGDSGILRMEATLKAAPQLRDMPLTLQADWREAQLGQLSRLIFGSDAGWRGDLRADVEVQGTLSSAQTKARLRATSVRREEFAPDTPLDFDANCGFMYLHSQNALHDISCDTAIGGGLLHLNADLPGSVGSPSATLEVQQLPLQAGLDLLRTVRSGFAPGISARGTANGMLKYEKVAESEPAKSAVKSGASARVRAGRRAVAVPAQTNNLQGEIVVDGAALHGGGLKDTLVLPRMSWTPVLVPDANAGPGSGEASLAGLATQFSLNFAPVSGAPTLAEKRPPALAKPRKGGPAQAPPAEETARPVSARPVSVRFAFTAEGFNTELSGTAPPARLLELAYAFGAPRLDAADSLVGGSADFDLKAAGNWIHPTEYLPATVKAASSTDAGPAHTTASAPAPVRGLAGTLELRDVQWKPSFLASPVLFGQANVTIAGGAMVIHSDFTFGTAAKTASTTSRTDAETQVAGTLSASAPFECAADDCVPQVQLVFGDLDAAAFQAALLGPAPPKTLLSPLIDKMRSSSKPVWPPASVTLQASSVALGEITLEKPEIHVQLANGDVKLESWQAGLLGGEAKGTGTFTWDANAPVYNLEGSVTQVDPAALSAVLQGADAGAWSGKQLSGSGKIQFSGRTGKDFAASAAGSVDFNWPGGVVTTAAQPSLRFDSWKGTLAVGDGKAQLGDNVMVSGRRSSSVAGTIVFGSPVKLTFTPSPAKAGRAGKAGPDAK